ncbi:solute carrier family 35 member F5 [Teleopsis dalmanni]|uniref:solute carrier family 35 member F5 n=1 Tax=Teleopsis dalmanni TaxID=139649 RepID=UPI0018CD0C1D|nr:solute carrier family 35 member F5 [Teleopsis dalmanni]XP_037950308.1 solute carrier family 35 member F5 [Teleopsis dalmanni]XP_037950309.1 solute carrier family 35 member F5 [Teleopsis dalmanni]XP_037950310.1 solute carrier family 35 member F5 [Teleopsis dalmanni]XP_037950311.1 solute carrier family 35 member F5 [Teleopsis dalmanni]XP_037950312.1 solute carrier family 35 member F5 [Teleopsis dalmanni]XP_037950313.1 solute carrier family 35 member F5 [Teleopsis dalmanni]
MLSKTQKLILGVTILVLVDVIWVSSSELTKFLYDDEKYDKPFFCTYFKTSMFTIYLIIIGLIAPWKESCEKQNGNYTIMDQTLDDENYYTNQASLSDPTFIPIRTGGVVSGTESDDSSIRSVRFSKMAEVREMSAHEATEALMARLSYAASMRIKRQKTHHKTAKTALLFCVLWFFANYLFQISLEWGETAMVTLLSSSSSLFTLVLAAFFPSATGDKFTITKFIAVAMNIGGVVTVTISDIEDANFSRSALLALFSAFFYAAYLVFVKRKSDTEEKIDIPLFFGFVGLWNMLLMWPIFFILNFLKIEKFELPNQNQFAVLFLNGLVGTVISEALWLWGCFLTSSLIGTIAMSLQIPLSIVFDLLLKRKPYSPMFYIGSVPIFIALILVSLLMRNDDSDPLMRLFKIIYRKICSCHKPNILRINDEEQQESLIGSND